MTHLPEVCYAYNVPESGVAKKAREDNGEFHPSARPAQKLAGQPKPRSVSISRYCVKSKERATPGMCIYNNLMRITFDPTTREKTPAVQQPALVLSTPPPAPKIPDSDAPHRSRRHRVRFTPRERPLRATLSTRVPTSLAPSSTPTPRSGDLLVSRPRDARRRAR